MLPLCNTELRVTRPQRNGSFGCGRDEGCSLGGGVVGRPPEGFQPRLCLISGIDHRGRDVGETRSSIGLNSPRKQEGSRMIGSRYRWNSLRCRAARLVLCAGATALVLALASPLAMAQ